MGKAASIVGQLLVTHLLHSSRSVPRSKTVLFPKWVSQASHFFGVPSLSISDQNCGRDSVGKAASIVGQLLVTHLLYTVQNLLAQQDSPNSFHTLLLFFFFFLWTSISEIKNEEETLQVKLTPLWVSF